MKRLKLSKKPKGRYIIKFLGFFAYCSLFDNAGEMALIFESDNRNNFC